MPTAHQQLLVNRWETIEHPKRKPAHITTLALLKLESNSN